jgi:hypothetical protein
MIAAAEISQTSDTKIAVIALAGAVIGGLLTGGAQLLAEQMRNKRADATAAARTLGVKRVLQAYLGVWHSIVEIAIANPTGRWWTAEVEPSVQWDGDDLKMVAAALSREQWRSVRRAITAARNMQATRIESIAEDQTVEEAIAEPANCVDRELANLSSGFGALDDAED